jgi:outer membrane protein assembly factor BamB
MVVATVAIAFTGSTRTVSAASSSTNWPQEGFNAQHTYYNATETILTRSNVGNLTHVFDTPLHDVGPDPIEANGAVYLSASGGGDVESINATTGAVNWTTNACNQGQETSIPAFAASKIWVGLNDPGTGAVNTAGTTVSCINIGDLFFAPPSVSHGIVYASGQDGAVVAINASTGSLLWQTCILCTQPGGGPFLYSSAVSVDSKWLFIAGNDVNGGGAVYKLNASTGALVWSHYVDTCGTTAVAVSGSFLIVNGCNLYARSATTGGTVWQTSHFGPTISAVAAAGGLVFASSNGRMDAFKATTGKMVWSFAYSLTVAPTVANGVVYVNGSNDLAMLNSTTGAQLGQVPSPASGDFTGSVVVVNGYVYACAVDGSTGAVALEAYRP